MLIGRRLMLLAGFWGACAVGVMPGLAREALNINGMWQVEPSKVQTAEFPVFSGAAVFIFILSKPNLSEKIANA